MTTPAAHVDSPAIEQQQRVWPPPSPPLSHSECQRLYKRMLFALDGYDLAPDRTHALRCLRLMAQTQRCDHIIDQSTARAELVRGLQARGEGEAAAAARMQRLVQPRGTPTFAGGPTDGDVEAAIRALDQNSVARHQQLVESLSQPRRSLYYAAVVGDRLGAAIGHTVHLLFQVVCGVPAPRRED